MQGGKAGSLCSALCKKGAIPQSLERPMTLQLMYQSLGRKGHVPGL